MRKAKELLKNLYEYSWENPEESIYSDSNNNQEIDAEEKPDLTGKFPDLHYDKISNYYSQSPLVSDNLTSRSCHMCSTGDKLHGLRFCRACYDKQRYKKRKVLLAPTTIVIPSNQQY